MLKIDDIIAASKMSMPPGPPGGGMGRWGEGVGRFFADWGTGWGAKIGASFSIIIGLAILYYFMYGRGKR